MISALILSVHLFTCCFATVQHSTTVYLIGDSTCADKSADAFPEMGWGTPFKTFFNENVIIENKARNGRSTKSFMEEGLWDDVLSKLQKDDYVFIQFGHNDEVPSKVHRYTTPEEFKANLIKYIIDTRQKGASPILLTPVSRRSFENGELKDTHQEYAQIVREVASEKEVPIIDMTKTSMELLEKWDIKQSQLLFHHLEKGEHPNYPNGKEDNTHFNELGARKMAQLVLDGVEELELDLVDNIVDGKR